MLKLAHDARARVCGCGLKKCESTSIPCKVLIVDKQSRTQFSFVILSSMLQLPQHSKFFPFSIPIDLWISDEAITMTAGGAAMACLHYYPGQEADPVVLTLANQSVSLNQSFSIYTPMDSMTVML